MDVLMRLQPNTDLMTRFIKSGIQMPWAIVTMSKYLQPVRLEAWIGIPTSVHQCKFLNS